MSAFVAGLTIDALRPESLPKFAGLRRELVRCPQCSHTQWPQVSDSQCVKCHTSLRGRDIDTVSVWRCRCGQAHIFEHQDMCGQCHDAAPDIIEQFGFSYTWECPKCHDFNFLNKTECMRCRTQRDKRNKIVRLWLCKNREAARGRCDFANRVSVVCVSVCLDVMVAVAHNCVAAGQPQVRKVRLARPACRVGFAGRRIA